MEKQSFPLPMTFEHHTTSIYIQKQHVRVCPYLHIITSAKIGLFMKHTYTNLLLILKQIVFQASMSPNGQRCLFNQYNACMLIELTRSRCRIGSATGIAYHNDRFFGGHPYLLPAFSTRPAAPIPPPT